MHPCTYITKRVKQKGGKRKLCCKTTQRNHIEQAVAENGLFPGLFFVVGKGGGADVAFVCGMLSSV